MNNRLNMKSLIVILLLSVPAVAGAQGWVYSPELGTDVWTGNADVDVGFIDCDKGSYSPQSAAVCMMESVVGGLTNPTFVSKMKTNIDGLYDKVEAGALAARPRRSSNPRSASEARRKGKSYNHQTSDAHRAWLADKRERQEEAQREAEEKKRREALARKIADDNRAAAVTAQTNAMLQQQTNRRIAKDYYHANEGARQAQQRARQAHRRVGPQFAQLNPKSTGKDKAKVLRGQNKPRRIMYPKAQKRNTVRQVLPQVQHRKLTPDRVAMLRKALMVRAELKRRSKAAQEYAAYKGIKLDDGAMSTLGKDWHSDDFKTGPLAPPPATRVYVTNEEIHQAMAREFIDTPPVTTREYRRFVNSEMPGGS